MIAPYIHEDLRDEIAVFEQHGDGIVMEWDSKNYPIEDVINAIINGYKDIDMRDFFNCPFIAI